MKRYRPSDIEQKWQKVWDDNKTYQADLNSKKPKYIAMGMFNYPSGAGIHIGHALNFTIPDVLARFKRQQGFESYHPVGWDSFGLPAENYAIKAGVSPQDSMAKIIPSYHKQYKAMGWSNDWSKEIATHEPIYYKWSQWIFSEMFRNKLAYQDSRMQWFCEKCQTVLANEQVIDDKCWRHDGPDDPIVTKREVKQWFFKVTEYADELLDAIDDLDWSESVKLAQKNWIGRSEGMVFTAPVKEMDIEIQTFSAHFEAFKADTFVAIAPEHPVLKELVVGTNDEQKVLEFASDLIKRREEQGYADEENVEGIFTGRYIVDPVGNGELPIWVASFALAHYGTGIVKCSAHDERDFRFAKKYNIPLKPVLFPSDKVEAEKVRNLEYCYYDMDEGVLSEPSDFSGQFGQKRRQSISKYLQDQQLATPKTSFKIRDWSVTRQRYWGAPTPIIHCPKCGPVLVPDEELPVILPVIKDYAPSGDGRSALGRASKDWLNAKCPQCGEMGERETDTLDTYIDSSWYMLRYFDPKNEKQIFDSKIINKWMPIDFYNGADHATAHMIYARFITRFFYKQGLVEEPEPFKRFLFNGKVTASDGKMFSKSKGNGVDPLEIINDGYGADALRTYLMFASPLDLWTRWDAQGVPGAFRFINRVWNLVFEFLEKTEKSDIQKSDGQNALVLKVIHPTIKKVTSDIEDLKYNTAIAALMKCTNDLYEIKARDGFAGQKDWLFALESLVMLMAPFAPHASEELWMELGHKDTIHIDHWPKWDEKYLVSDKMTIVVQVNGKVRAELEVDSDASEEDIKAEALKNEKVQKHLEGNEPKKIIYVPGRLVSLVI